MKSFLTASAVMFLFFSAPGSAQTVRDVYSFPSENAAPGFVTPIQGRDGALYGTVSGAGTTMTTDGSIFRMGLSGKITLLHSFAGTDGEFPLTGLTLGADGDYYGATTEGGSSDNGMLFKLTPSGTYSILYEFTGGSDGASPLAPAILASDGDFYGTTDADNANSGAIYKYSPSTGAFAAIFDFSEDQSQGVQIWDPLVEGVDGNLYGTAQDGGANGCGTIFELNRSGGLLQLYSFRCGPGGSSPAGPLIQASDGSFYGTTALGGVANFHCHKGCGTVFRMRGGVVSILYNFAGPPYDGAFPEAGLVEGTDGNLYGAAFEGGIDNRGALFQISKSGQYKLLYKFSDEVGNEPAASLLQHTNGKFYGTTQFGGANAEGALYSLDMGLGPFIALVRYTAGIGQPVQILGQGLTGSTSVTINGVPATTFSVVSDTYMTAVVPAGASSGPIVVTTPAGTLTSNHNLRIVE
jgi:uncharacterized repeat protein (TIGR03803 family)